VRINWEDGDRKGIRHKNGGMAEVGTPISLDGVAVHPIVGTSAFVIFILLQKIQKMVNVWYWLFWVVPD